MVAAFEQSLSNMTSRLQHLTASAEQKVGENHIFNNPIVRNKFNIITRKVQHCQSVINMK